MAELKLFDEQSVLNNMRGTEFHEVAAGTNSGATATKAATTGARHFITQICGHTDKDSLIQVLDGSTVKEEFAIDVDVDGKSIDHSFNPAIEGTLSGAVSAKIASSTTDCFVSVKGYSSKNTG